MKINELLDATKNAKGIKSDGELARMLGVSKQAVSRYYLGERAPDEFACLKIAEALGMPLNTVIATVKASSEKDEKRREAWQNYMKRLGGLAASIAITCLLGLLCAVTTIVTSSTAEAHPTVPVSGSSLYYVNSATWKTLVLKVQAILRRVRQKCTFRMNIAGIAQIAT